MGNMKILYLNTNSMIPTFRKNSKRRRRKKKSTLFLSKSNSNMYARSFLFYSFNCAYSWETRHQSRSPEEMGNKDVCLASRSSQRLKASHGTRGDEAPGTTLPDDSGKPQGATLCAAAEGAARSLSRPRGGHQQSSAPGARPDSPPCGSASVCFSS